MSKNWEKLANSEEALDLLKSKIAMTFRGEVLRDDLPDLLQAEFKDMFKEGSIDFKAVADFLILQEQNLGTVEQGCKYRTKYFRVFSRKDNHSSLFCQSMGGRIIPADHLKKQIHAINSAKTLMEKMKFLSYPEAPCLNIELPASIGIPPYHLGCRTILQSVFLRDEDVSVGDEQFSVFNTGQFPAGKNGFAFSHIDILGIERLVPSSVMNGISPSEIKDCLDDIKSIAQHADSPNKFVALAGKGYVLVFEGELLAAISKPQKAKKVYQSLALSKKGDGLKRFWGLFQKKD